ncbi:hypothetical protein PCO86_16935 [Pectobacteriaceae bacterium CE70]|nr:hypothetical protein PCO87_17650 [Pectobacteriaceae bacterium C52]WJV65945.1 hypothetical protein PCO86_16935 [Pectobacteriaceae bacterium CE70]WJY09963.1 hypothetical protein PCO80_16875 [Pectobacteriaceae bacterium C80]
MDHVSIPQKDCVIDEDKKQLIFKKNSKLEQYLITNTSSQINTSFGKISVKDITVQPDGRIVFNNIDAEKTKALFDAAHQASTRGDVVVNTNIGNCGCSTN